MCLEFFPSPKINAVAMLYYNSSDNKWPVHAKIPSFGDMFITHFVTSRLKKMMQCLFDSNTHSVVWMRHFK